MRVRRKPRGNFRHGEIVHRKQSAEYTAFQSAKARCGNKRRADYKNYGARGIKFLFKSFHQFLKEVGRKPSPKHLLDRIKNDGHYKPGNVHWATHSESLKNRRMTKRRLLANRKNFVLARKVLQKRRRGIVKAISG